MFDFPKRFLGITEMAPDYGSDMLYAVALVRRLVDAWPHEGCCGSWCPYCSSYCVNGHLETCPLPSKNKRPCTCDRDAQIKEAMNDETS